jgi:hypothetical protein
MCVTQGKRQNPEKTVLKEEKQKTKKTTNLSQRHHQQLSSILIPTSQQFDTEWFVFFFFFFFVFLLLLQSKSQLKSKSSMVSSSSSFFFFFSQQILRVQKSRKPRDPESKLSHARNKSQWQNQETREIAKIINTFVSAGRGWPNVWVSCAPIGRDVDSTNQRPALVHISWEIK